MATEIDFETTLTYKFLKILKRDLKEFFRTLGNIGKDFCVVFKYCIQFQYCFKRIIEQSQRYAVSSLPITLTIVSMTSIIIAIQIAPELAKQGGGDYMGMLSGIVMVRELGAIMTAFAIISMIGSSFASEIASMCVTEQISAMKVLHVDPIEYLIVPRFLAGVIMMPLVVIISSSLGLFIAGIVSKMVANISYLNFIISLRQGIVMKDVFVSLLKSSVFGATISLISCSIGYETRGGAKEVGIATTKAVVWSFLAIACWDFIFALVFYL